MYWRIATEVVWSWLLDRLDEEKICSTFSSMRYYLFFFTFIFVMFNGQFVSKRLTVYCKNHVTGKCHDKLLIIQSTCLQGLNHLMSVLCCRCWWRLQRSGMWWPGRVWGTWLCLRSSDCSSWMKFIFFMRIEGLFWRAWWPGRCVR